MTDWIAIGLALALCAGVAGIFIFATYYGRERNR